MNPRVGVAVLIIKDGTFLMGQRRGSHGEGTWSAPGGWLEYKESFEEAGTREVKEETGLDVKNIQFAGITNNIFKDDPTHSITVWLTAEWASGKPTITEPDKFIDQKWVTFDSLPAPLFLPWEELLASEFIDVIKQRFTEV
jgi:8-oxo-dGTP diphosphatase